MKRCLMSAVMMREHFTTMRISTSEAIKKLEPSYITGGNVKWYGCFGKQFGSPQNVKQSYHMTQQFHYWLSTQVEWKHM